MSKAWNDQGSAIEAALCPDVLDAIERQQRRFAALATRFGDRFVVFGAGRLGMVVLAGLRQAGFEPVAFADNNPRLWYTAAEGLPILPPQEAVGTLGEQAAFVASVYTSAPVKRQLMQLGVTSLSFPALAWSLPEIFLPHGCLDRPERLVERAAEVRAGLDLWSDERSRMEYVAQIRWRTTLDDAVLPEHEPATETYFPPDIVRLGDGELFADCGAFDGDTVRAFLARCDSHFTGVVAFEPDPENFSRLQQFITGLPAEVGRRITAVPAAVGDGRGRAHLLATGTRSSSLNADGAAVDIVPLDEALAGREATFIKMDVEGNELAALSGARQVIAQCRPDLAVCLYHRQEDLWVIPSFVSSVCPDYELFLRRHADECWEMVLYATCRRATGPAGSARSGEG